MFESPSGERGGARFNALDSLGGALGLVDPTETRHNQHVRDTEFQRVVKHHEFWGLEGGPREAGRPRHKLEEDAADLRQKLQHRRRLPRLRPLALASVPR